LFIEVGLKVFDILGMHLFELRIKLLNLFVHFFSILLLGVLNGILNTFITLLRKFLLKGKFICPADGVFTKFNIVFFLLA